MNVSKKKETIRQKLRSAQITVKKLSLDIPNRAAAKDNVLDEQQTARPKQRRRWDNWQMVTRKRWNTYTT